MARFRSWLSILLITGAFLALPAWTAPRNPERYERVTEKLADIPNGSVVEGSVVKKGLQPDYVIDFNHPNLRPLIGFARQVGRSDETYWQKIRRIVDYVSALLPEREYTNGTYRSLMKKYRARNRDIPLAAYIACGAGVCREHAFLLHMALKEAGIPNRHVYAQVELFGTSLYRKEDHAFVVVEKDGERWMLDSYNSFVHGTNFDEAMGPKGVEPYGVRAPLTAMPGQRSMKPRVRVLEILSFPAVWKPKQPVPIREVPLIQEPACYESYRSLGEGGSPRAVYSH